jgi:hypothetical protein
MFRLFGKAVIEQLKEIRKDENIFSCVVLRFSLSSYVGGTRWRSWLRHCATSRKVAGSIPDGVIGFFH